MKELSLNILDIAQNSIKAGAKHVGIVIRETETELSFEITDDGCGMTPDFLSRVTDPFTTTRTTRKVGMGLPLLKMEAEMAGGKFHIESKSEKEYPDLHGTKVFSSFDKTNIDFIPLGDIVSTLCVLIQGADKTEFSFEHIMPGRTVSLSTEEMKEMLGDVPLGCPEVIAWVRDYLNEGYQSPDTV